MALTRYVKKSCSWKSLLDVNVRNRLIPQQPRLFSTVDVKSGKCLLVGHLNHEVSFQPVARYSTRGHRVAQREKPKDLYATLDVSPSATQQQMKDSYYKLSLKYHPDRNRGSLEAHQKFTELTEAYSVLGQYELRKKYDKGLMHQYPGRHHTTHHPAATHAKTSTQFMDRDKVKYNFDEFYKAHYGDALKRQQDIKRKAEEAKINATYYNMPKQVQQMLIIGLSLSVLAVGLIILPLPQPKVQVKTLKR